MLSGALVSSGMNACIRHVSGEVHAFEIAFFRNLFGIAVLLPFLLRAGGRGLRTTQLKLHALRGVLNAVAMLAFFLALTLTPLATVAALNFTSPLFATLLAVLILGERVRPWHVLGLIGGFLGVLLIVRPGVEAISAGALLVLLSSSMWSAAMIDIKVLSRTESTLAIALYAAIFLTPFTLLPALPYWTWPSGPALLWLAAIGVLGSLYQLMLTQAFKLAEASRVLPADFTKLLWATLIGYLFFGELPDRWTAIGGTLICASVVLIVWRDARSRREAALSSAAPGTG